MSDITQLIGAEIDGAFSYSNRRFDFATATTSLQTVVDCMPLAPDLLEF